MKAAVFVPGEPTALQLLLLLGIVLLFLGLGALHTEIRGKKGRSVWFGLFAALSAASIWKFGAGLFPFSALVPLFLKRPAHRKSAPEPEGPKKADERAAKWTRLEQQNQMLRKRILETRETFVSQAPVFEAFLTLNEIQLIHGVLESLTRLFRARQLSFYRYDEKTRQFRQAARFHSEQGWFSRGNMPLSDRLLFLILESRSVLTVREILNNEMLLKIWKSSPSRGLIYAPVFHGRQFFGVLTIDEIPPYHLNRQTVQNARAAAKLMALAFTNISAHQALLLERNNIQSKILTEYQQFLRSFNLEFKRARRNNLPLSLLHIAIEPASPRSMAKPPEELITRIRQNIRKNLREVDLLFADDLPGRFWVVLPHTDFSGLAYVMERLNLLIHFDLAEQHNIACRFGFSFLEPDISLPKQMMLACQESLKLHRTVEEILAAKQKKSSVEK